MILQENQVGLFPAEYIQSFITIVSRNNLPVLFSKLNLINLTMDCSSSTTRIFSGILLLPPFLGVPVYYYSIEIVDIGVSKGKIVLQTFHF